jgi:RNA polymerase sigma-70 factor (ECF subfamily)
MTETSTQSLLERLRQPHANEAWQRFVALHTPLLRFWTRRLGVHNQDAEDLIQEVFAVVLQKLPTFRHGGGHTFRHWLRTVTRNKWIDLRRHNKLLRHADAAALAEVPAPADDFWERDYRRYLVKRALDLMQADFQATTWKACWEVVAHGRPAAEVAEELALTVGAVHAARARVLARLREELGQMMD